MALCSAGDRWPRELGVAGERVLVGELLEPAEPSCCPVWRCCCCCCCTEPTMGETGTDTGMACGTLLVSTADGVKGEGVVLGSAWWELGC